MEQRSNYATMKDARTKPNEEKCAEGMKQQLSDQPDERLHPLIALYI